MSRVAGRVTFTEAGGDSELVLRCADGFPLAGAELTLPTALFSGSLLRTKDGLDPSARETS